LHGAGKDEKAGARMIDNFALGLTHVLMIIAAFLLIRRPDLDREPGPADAGNELRPANAGNGDADNGDA
jgi:hypothetical protein